MKKMLVLTAVMLCCRNTQSVDLSVPDPRDMFSSIPTPDVLLDLENQVNDLPVLTHVREALNFGGYW